MTLLKPNKWLPLLVGIAFNFQVFGQAPKPADDGVIVATENFDAVTPPTPASNYFTFDPMTTLDFKNTVAFSAAADPSGTGKISVQKSW